VKLRDRSKRNRLSKLQLKPKILEIHYHNDTRTISKTFLLKVKVMQKLSEHHKLKVIKGIIENADLQTFSEIMFKAGTTRED